MSLICVIRTSFACRRRSALIGLIGGLVVASLGVAASVTYEYDNLGRLRKATFGDGAITEYTLDAAGNRTAVTQGIPAGAPASIVVPTGSATGGYTISWTAPAGGPAVTAYQLFEANNAAFTGESQAYSGLGLSLPVSGKPNGTYYYRVRACAGAMCSLFVAGATGVLVAIPPSTPQSITVPPTNNTGTFTISWGTSLTGTVSAYELWEATSSSFSGESRVYNSTGTSTSLTRAAGTYYFHVRACNGPNCSSFTAGSPNVVVALPPATPASITAPSTNNTGGYRVQWAGVSGTVTAYELWEATNASFTGETRIYNSNANTFLDLTGKVNGSYYYRARACNSAGCSGYATSTGTSVALPPGAPNSITVPAANTTGSYTVSWTAPLTGTVTGYQLYEATNSSFSGETNVYTGTGTSFALSGKGNASYWYRVRACNGAGNCGGLTSGGPAVVALTPGTPGALSMPGSSTTGSYTVSWGASSGTVSEYQLAQYRNDPGYSTIPSVWTSTTTSVNVTVTQDGVYSYRVRACYSTSCSGFTNGGGVGVTLPPGAPNSITVPATNTTGSYTVAWTAPLTGTVTGYQLYEATNSSFSGETNVYSGTSTSFPLTGKGNASYWYRVRACNGAGNCGGLTSGGPAVVALTPGTPGALSMPGSSTTGSYTVSWGPSSGTVTEYQLAQYRNDPGYSTIPSVWTSTTTSVNVTVTQDGVYSYRVRACYLTSCSGFSNGGGVGVTLPPGAPAAINVPNSSTDGNIALTWSAASSGTPTSYVVYEATNSAFTGAAVVFSGNATSTTLTNRSDGAYWYRVQACNASGCSVATAGANGTSVLRIPTAPVSLFVPSTAAIGANYTVSWPAASGAGITYELQEATTLDFPQPPNTTTGTSLTFSKPSAGTYYYRVRACNASGCSSYVGNPSIAVVATTSIVLDDVQVSGEVSLGTITFNYGLSSNGFILITANGASVLGPTRPFWITPQSGMTQYQARATSPCLYKTGTFGATSWQTLGTGVTRNWGVNLTPNKTISCAITIDISAISNPTVILETATISLELSTAP